MAARVIPMRRPPRVAAAQFLQWFRSREPRAARMAGLGGLGEDPLGPASSDSGPVGPATSWLDSIAQSLQTLTPALSQAWLVNINLQRAKQGLPPIDSSAIAPTVNVGVAPQIQIVLWAALGIGALALLLGARR